MYSCNPVTESVKVIVVLPKIKLCTVYGRTSFLKLELFIDWKSNWF